ncbi:uncharacterized protein LOC143170379 [Aptenodytes patagonicus]|uniref:uncharacterized protein LOC143170379 n=1 Tax=Aptenodytes patagonicus TaxID=9234 RepID=UPI003FA04768
MPSAVLPPGRESPESDPDSQVREEGCLDEGKRRPSDVSDSGRRFAGTRPNKLHPLLVSKFSRPCQTSPDAENMIEKGSSFSSFDVDTPQDQDTPLKMREKLCLDSSDSQSVDLEVRPPVQPLCVSRKSYSQDFKKVKTLIEALEDKILLSEDEELKEKWKMKDEMGERVHKPCHHFSVREKSTGLERDVERSPGMWQARGKESFYRGNDEMTLFDASPTDDWGLQEAADVPYAQEELRSYSKASERRSKRKVRDEALGQAISLYKSNETISRPERKGLKQMEVGADIEVGSSNDTLESRSADPQEITDVLPCFQGVAAKRGIDVDLHSAVDPTSEHVCSSAEDGWRNDEESGLISEYDSSDSASSHNDNAPQLLGVSRRFSPRHEAGRQKDVHAVAEEPLPPHPLLGSSLAQTLSPARQSERECSSEGRKLCHRLQDCEKGLSPEPERLSPMVDSCGECAAQKPNGAGAQREAERGNGRTGQAPGVRGEKVAADLRVECQGSNSLRPHTKAEMTQTGGTAGRYSKVEVGEGAGGKEVGLSPL